MARQKKQVLTIIILLLCLALLWGAYVLVSRQVSDGEEEDAQGGTLYSLEEGQIAQIRYKNSYGEFQLAKQDGEWKLQSDKEFPVDQDKVDTMAADMASVSYTRMVKEGCEDFSEYQLDKPTLTVELVPENGESRKIAYGMESGIAGGCYVRLDDGGTVYLASSDALMDFEYTKNQLMELPQLPEIEADYVTSYSVKSKKGEEFQAVYRGEKAVNKDIYGWDITKGFKKTMPGDADALQSLFEGAGMLAFDEGVSYRATEKQKKQYGLAEPNYTLDVKYFALKEGTSDSDSGENGEDAVTEPLKDIPEKNRKYHTLTLYVGSPDDTEEHYYVSAEGESGIYLMAAETVDSLVKFDARDCVYEDRE